MIYNLKIRFGMTKIALKAVIFAKAMADGGCVYRVKIGVEITQWMGVKISSPLRLNGFAMTTKQINFAAKLYSLSQVALLDEGNVENNEQVKVLRQAVKRARAALERMGFSQGFATLQDCIDVAKESA